MKSPFQRTTVAIATLLFLNAVQAFGLVLLQENFTGTSLDTDVWTSGGQWGPTVTVANGTLTVGNQGNSWFSFARTVAGSLNFHEDTYTVTIALDDFAEPNWSSASASYSNSEIYFAMGPAENRSQINSSDTSVTGFHFALRWQRDHGLDLRTRSNVGVPQSSLDAVPALVRFTLDATSYTLELLDAGGSPIYSESGDHGIGPLSTYHFMALHQMGGFSSPIPFTSAAINSVVIESSAEPGAPPAPIDLTAVGRDGQVILDWSAVAGADSYNVKRAISGDSLQTIANRPSPGYVDTDVTNGVTYDYAVTSVSDQYGEGADSAIASATPASMEDFDYVHLQDDFSGTSLDGSVWTSGGQWGPTVTVGGGRLTVGNQGNSWFSYARTASGHFDFHDGGYGITVDLADFAEPDWSSATAPYTNSELFFSVGPAESRSNVNSSNTSVTGFSFNLRWQRDQGLDITTRSNVGVTPSNLDEVPAQIHFTLDATNFSLTLLDAAGTVLYSDEGTHGIGSLDSYHFMILHQMGGFSSPPFTSGVINSVTIEGNTEPPALPDPGPAIVVQPRDITVVETQIPAFMVEAQGSGTLSYQWFRDGEPIGDANEDWYFPPFASAGDHEARFHVEVTDNLGTEISDSAYIYISEYSAREEMARPDSALADYHIDPVNGHDGSGDGSAAAPFRTFAKVLPLLSGGEIVLFHPGLYPQIQITPSLASVPFSDWVTLMAAPGSQPEIDSLRIIGTAKTPLISRNGGTDFRVRIIGMHIRDGVRIEQANYVRLEECLLTRRGPFNNTAANLEKSAVRIESARSVTIEDCEITETAHGVQGPTNDLVIRRTHIHYIAHDAIRVWGCDVVLIEDCLIHNLDDGYQDDNPLSMHTDGIQIYRAGHHRQNLMDNNNNLTVRNNRFFHISNMGIMVEGDLGMMHNWVFENNVFGPSGGFLIHIKRPVQGFIFRHNSIVYVEDESFQSMYRHRNVGSYAVALPAREESSEVYVYNNIFHGPSPRPGGSWTEFTVDSRHAEIFENNLYYLRTLTNPDIGANPVIVEDSPFANPEAYDGVLKRGSAAKVAGTTFDPIGVDIYGTSRGLVPSIGAVEYVDPDDTEPPVVPQNLVAVPTYATTNLSWDASTDNQAVGGYLVFRNDAFVAKASETNFTDTGLEEDTTYTYRVAAFDEAGNQSEPGLPITVTTEVRPDNIALGRPVSASSWFAEHLPEHAVDGTTDTEWNVAGRGPHWLVVDLDGEFVITGIDILMYRLPFQNFLLQAWEKGHWIDIPGAVVTENESDSVVLILPEPLTTTSQIRFFVADVISSGSLHQLRVFGDSADIKPLPSWAGYEARSPVALDIDTGDWLGKLVIGQQPWLWSLALNAWVFAKDPGDKRDIWIYVPVPGGFSPAGGTSWAGFAEHESGYANTGKWLGNLYITHHPWMWSQLLNSWIYAPDPGMEPEGVWIHVRE